MATRAKIIREHTTKLQKNPIKKHNRCGLCGRPRGYLRLFGICRLCFRKLASNGEIPGVKKASW